jgi:hypothetical protein
MLIPIIHFWVFIIFMSVCIGGEHIAHLVQSNKLMYIRSIYFITWKNDSWIVHVDVLFFNTLKNHNEWNMVDEKSMKYVYFVSFHPSIIWMINLLFILIPHK